MKSPKQIITALEEKGVTRGQIALHCMVEIRTVNNWRTYRRWEKDGKKTIGKNGRHFLLELAHRNEVEV
jgi:hypothetical protein